MARGATRWSQYGQTLSLLVMKARQFGHMRRLSTGTIVQSQPMALARFAYQLPPETYRRAVEYAQARYLLHFLAVLWGMLVLAALIRWRFAPWLRDRVESAGGGKWLQALLFAPPLLLLLAMVELPADAWRHHLALEYRQSVEGWPAWFADWAKAQAMGLAAGTFVVWLLYAVIRRAPGRWWFYFWLSTLPLMVSAVFIAPLVIDPMFHSFRPLEERHPDLVRRLERLTA
ncbi:MAG: hypothetical protein NTY38_32175, partial [Acidobacteria bacterium]|nr:hypothetical protein [Acidobacteriota bacterium]